MDFKNFLNIMMNTKANVMAIVGFIAVSIILVIGLVILSAIVGAINMTPNFTPISNGSIANPFYSIYNALVSTIGSGYAIMAIVLLVIAAVTIMGYLTLMMSGGGRR